MSTPVDDIRTTLDRALEDHPEEGVVRVNRRIFTDPEIATVGISQADIDEVALEVLALAGRTDQAILVGSSVAANLPALDAAPGRRGKTARPARKADRRMARRPRICLRTGRADQNGR